jgi:predicted lipoprotein
MFKHAVIKRVLLGIVAMTLAACHVVDLDENGKPMIPMSAADAGLLKNMTPEEISDKLWPSINKEAHEKAIELSTIGKNENLISFVRFQGKVSRFDQTSLKTSLVVNSGSRDIELQIGKIIKGNSIRDSASLISFDQFKNQIQFAQLSKALNKKAINQIGQPDATWVGKTVTVLAALTIKANKITHAVPLEIKEGAM